MDKTDNARLDELNNKRVETTKLRVAHAIKLMANPIGCLAEGRRNDNAMTNIAHGVNLLEAASEEMKWACAHFEWNDEVCFQIDDACSKLGNCLAILAAEDDNDYDPELAAYDGNDALAILGKVLATLIRWFDDEQDVSEV